MNDDGQVRVELRPVARTRAQGRQQRRFRMALKVALVILVSALTSVVLESWGLGHRMAQLAGVACGLLAQQGVPPRLRWSTIGWIGAGAAVLTGALALLGR